MASFLGISSIRLDPFTGLAGDQCRRCYRAVMAEIDELSIDPVTASAGLVAERQATALPGQSLGELGDVGRRVWNGTNEPDCAVSSLFRRGNGNAHLVNIEPNIKYLLHVPLSDRRDAAPPSAASRLCRSLAAPSPGAKGHTDLAPNRKKASVPQRSGGQSAVARPVKKAPAGGSA